MQPIQQVVYILLYLLFFIRNAFTFNIDILLKENSDNTNVLMSLSEWKCNSNDDCTAKNSVCSDKLCQCGPDYIFNADMTACVKVATRLYDTCEETVQCSAYLLSGAKCVENVCVCGPGYYYLHGRCNQYVDLFEKCKQNDCYVNADFEASVCDVVEGICKCSSGFYQREYRTCRREGKAVGDDCTIDIDCTFDHATCSNFVCAMKSAKAVELSLRSDVVLTKGILDERTQIDSINCTIDEECRVIGNAICGPAGTCRCDRAHFASDTDTECIPELGESCQNDDDSHIQKSICREGRWACTKDTVASKDNRECLNATTEYMGNCQQDEQCYIFGPDAICDNNTCICNENVSHYVESELFCWGNTGIDNTCKQDLDCYVKDFKGSLTCNVTCGCPDGTRLSKDKMACIGPTELGGLCEKDSDCAVPFSVCEGNVCTCAENYYQLLKQCLAGINADCTDDKDCIPVNSMCISEKCSCKSNYAPVSINSCKPVSLFGKSCLLDIQCSAVTTGAICATIDQSKGDIANKTISSEIVENKVCVCKNEDYYKLGRCFKKQLLGETCINLGECYEDDNQNKIVCKNGKCSCVWGYMASNSSVCVINPQGSKDFYKGGANNIHISMGFLIIPFIFSNKLI